MNYYLISPRVDGQTTDGFLEQMYSKHIVMMGWGTDKKIGVDFQLLKRGDFVLVAQRVNWKFNYYFAGIISDQSSYIEDGCQCRKLEYFVDLRDCKIDFLAGASFAGMQVIKAMVSINPHYNKMVVGKLRQIIQYQKQKENMETYKNILLSNHNLILTGAPGTGKTYLAKQIAAELLKVNDIQSLNGNRHFGFVQFHPSYDYTDFVEGLRPVNSTEAGSIGFERKDGVFKEFCKHAALDVSQESAENKVPMFNRLYELLLQKIKDGDIDCFSQRTGKPIFIKEVSTNNNLILIVSTDQETDDETERTYTVSFNRLEKLSRKFPDKSSLHSISNIDKEIRAVIGGCNTSAYWAVLNQLWEMNHLNETNNNEDPIPYVFVIDEINRGELSKIFGELFFSIDPGYRGQAGTVTTQYQNLVSLSDIFGNGFYIPQNVYIIGTMNDIDRSVESMDFAMRRRFAWKEVSAAESYQTMIEGSTDFTDDEKKEIQIRMESLNMAILKPDLGLGVAFQIGAAYFRKYLVYKDHGTEEAFNMLWENHLSGLLYEYLRGNKNAQKQLDELKDAYNKKPNIE